LKLTCLKPRLATSNASRLTASRPDTKDNQRGTANSRGYNYRWQKASKAWLAKHPWCVYCKREGYDNAASLVDHIIPHRGDMKRFWDSKNNWMSLCTTCHNSTKKKEEAKL